MKTGGGGSLKGIIDPIMSKPTSLLLLLHVTTSVSIVNRSTVASAYVYIILTVSGNRLLGEKIDAG